LLLLNNDDFRYFLDRQTGIETLVPEGFVVSVFALPANRRTAIKILSDFLLFHLNNNFRFMPE